MKRLHTNMRVIPFKTTTKNGCNFFVEKGYARARVKGSHLAEALGFAGLGDGVDDLDGT